MKATSLRDKLGKEKPLVKQSEDVFNDWYITQQGCSNKIVLNHQESSNNRSYQRIIEKITQEEDRKDDSPTYLKGGRIDSPKKIKPRTASTSRVRHDKKSTIKLREHAQLNIINIQ